MSLPSLECTWGWGVTTQQCLLKVLLLLNIVTLRTELLACELLGDTSKDGESAMNEKKNGSVSSWDIIFEELEHTPCWATIGS